MSETLPFNLTQEQLPDVGISYASYSAKSGVGKAEITISGSGELALLQETVRDDPNPRVFTETIPMAIVTRLLDVLQEENFFALDDYYPHSGTPTGTRVITLTLPGRTKQVILDQPASAPAFERVAGAIKLAAGLATPEALQQRFFQRF